MKRLFLHLFHQQNVRCYQQSLRYIQTTTHRLQSVEEVRERTK